MVHVGCVLVAGIHPSRTRMSGSFKSLRWNACVHRLDLGLHSHPKELEGWGGGRADGVRTHVNTKGKIPSPGGSEEGRTGDVASGRTASPTHYRLSYSGSAVFFQYRNTSQLFFTWRQAIKRLSRATCRVPRGTKGQLSC